MLLRAGFVLALLAVVVALSPSRTAACSCAALGDPNPLENADVAFIGTVARVDDTAGPISLFSSGFEPLLYTFAVEEVQKGDLGEFAVIRSGRGDGDCGVAMSVGERWSIFADGSGDELWVNICGPSGSSVRLADGVTPPLAPDPLPPDLGLLAVLVAAGLVGLALVVLVRQRRIADAGTS